MLLGEKPSHFSLLAKLSDEQFSLLVSICFKFLTGKEPPSKCLVMYKQFSDHCGIELSNIEPCIKSLLRICKDSVKAGRTVVQLQEEMVSLGMAEKQADILVKEWEAHYSFLAQINSEDTVVVNQLLDMEWKFGVCSASSELNTVGNVFLQMKLEIEDSVSGSRSVRFELSLPEFYAFLHEMERIRASLDYLS